jgi:F420H(2)-dependent quinone reductase
MRSWHKIGIVVAVAVGAFFVISQLTVAERLIRVMYPGGRPSEFARRINGSWSWLVSMSITPSRWPGRPVCGPATIEVRGRRSGKPRSTMTTWIEHEGDRYFVSMLSERSDWVRNSRAAGGEAVLRRRTRRKVHLEEVPVEARAPIIQAWYQRTWRSTRPHFGLAPDAPLAAFEDAAREHPVFRLRELPGDVDRKAAKSRGVVGAIANQITIWSLQAGIPRPPYTRDNAIVVETIGRRSGRRRRVPVGVTEEAGKLFVVVEDGGRADWVRNVLQQDGRLRVFHSGTWKPAHLRMTGRNPESYLARMNRLHAALVRRHSSEPAVAEISLSDVVD